jgi:hypothetical protein
MPARLRPAAAALLWIALAVALAVGGSGIVAATNRQPGEGTRPELTWAADRALSLQLDAATRDLAALSDQVDALGTTGRRALVALVDRDVATLRGAVGAGSAQIVEIARAAGLLRAQLAAVPVFDPEAATRTGAAVHDRADRLVAALAATDGLAASWDALTAGSLAAIELTTSLAEHDKQAVAAVILGGKGEYGQALTVLELADAALATSKALRDRLARTVDAGVLTEWIDRNATFDAAIRQLWALLDLSKGKVTPAIRTAFEAQRTAQANLPPDSRALVVVMADVARGGINQAVIDIEQARGRLASAVADSQAAQPSPSPSPAPAGAP